MVTAKRPEEINAPLTLPHGMVNRSNEALYYGAELGPDGHSPFVAAMTVGVYIGETADRRRLVFPVAAYREHEEYPEARAALIAKLKEMISDLEDVTTAQGQPAS